MREFLYDVGSVAIAAILFITMTLAIEAGYRLGLKSHGEGDVANLSQIGALQSSLLGILALLLGFTFSLALQRFDTRSAAVVDEANAIGTAYLRTQLLPPTIGEELRKLTRDYVDIRVEASTLSLDDQNQRQALLQRANANLNQQWAVAMRVAREEPSTLTSGLYIQALNTLIDSLGKRIAELDRHVPELVLLLLYCTFIMTGVIVGYNSGLSGHRVSLATYILVSLIVLLVFIIIDLDRPRRGLIQVSRQSLIELQSAMREDAKVAAPAPPPAR